MRKPSVLLAIAFIMLLLAAGRFYFSGDDFSPENYGWNGMSYLSSTADVRPLYELSSLSATPAGDTLLVVSPSTDYTADEAASVYSFLGRGGRVVVMDDFGKADSLLRGIGSPITIRAVPLQQYDRFYVNQSGPIVNVTTGSPYSVNVRTLVLNYPASLNLSGTADVIASTTDKGWLDTDGNYRLGRGERAGTYPVIATSRLGRGELLVIADPDIFINVMIDKGDNRAFLSNVLKGRVWVDASHGRSVTPIAALFYAIKYSPVLQCLVVLLVLAGMAMFLLRRRIVALVPGRRVDKGDGTLDINWKKFIK